MRNSDLVNALGRIDDDLIDRAARYREKGEEAHEQVRNVRQPLYRRMGLIAACLILLLCAVPVAKRLMNGVTPGVIPPDSQPVTDVVENPDFIIENGVLLSYVGNDPHVVVPDEVVEISRDAFAEKGDVIETIYIGKNVEVVDSLFLSEVKHLASIEVADENERFEIYEGVFVDKKANVYIDVLNNYADSISEFGALVWNLQEGTVDLKETELVFVLYNVKIYTTLEVSEYDPSQKNLYVEKIEFKNNTINGNDNNTIRGLFLGALGVINLYQGNDYAMISRTSWGSGEIFLMTDDRVYDLSQWHEDMLVKDYNESFYYYSQGEDGTLLYERMPVKFVPTMDGGDVLYGLQHATGFDEFYKETGYVTFKDGQPQYVPTASYTVEEAGKKEFFYEQFAQWKHAPDTWGGDPNATYTDYFPDFDTLEELYRYNQNNNVESAR